MLAGCADCRITGEDGSGRALVAEGGTPVSFRPPDPTNKWVVTILVRRAITARPSEGRATVGTRRECRGEREREECTLLRLRVYPARRHYSSLQPEPVGSGPASPNLLGREKMFSTT